MNIKIKDNVEIKKEGGKRNTENGERTTEMKRSGIPQSGSTAKNYAHLNYLYSSKIQQPITYLIRITNSSICPLIIKRDNSITLA
jgi:hypothetical protein